MDTLANVLDPIHDSLPRDVWDHPASPEPKLKGKHSQWILSTIDRILTNAGYTHVQDWLSLVLTGSLTTYQYDKHSDCDISLFVNSDVFPEWSRAEMIGLMVKSCDGLLLPGTPYQLQGFVVAKNISKDDLYAPGLRSGWDIDNHRWIEPPDPTRVHDVEREMNASYAYALEQADKMERLLRYEPDKATMFWHMIHKRRMRDQKAGKGDYSDSNIVYKFLANRGLMPRISEVSGEYIAKTSAPWNRNREYEDWEYQGLKGKQKQQAEIQQWTRGREKNWDRAYQLGVSPHEHNPELRMRNDREYVGLLDKAMRPKDYYDNPRKYQGQRFYTPEMDAAWHKNFQQKKQQQFLMNPDTMSHEYEDWLEWYAQHAPQHFDPDSAAANAEPWNEMETFGHASATKADEGFQIVPSGVAGSPDDTGDREPRWQES